MVLLRAVSAGDVAAVQSALAAALDGSGPAVLPMPRDPRMAERVRAATRPDDPSAPLERGHDATPVAAVVATSGSTGQPKGVLLTAGALLASARATLDRLGGPGQWLLALGTDHVAGLQVLVRSLVARTQPVVLDPALRFDAASFIGAAERLDAGARRYTALVPTQLGRLLDAGGGADDALAAFHAVLLGGAAASPDLLRRAAERGARVVTTYGMSETSGGCVYDGRPLHGVHVELADDGQIRIRGPVLAAGYRLLRDLTQRAFAGGAFRTSDLGRWTPDGLLEVLGRCDDVIVTGGHNVVAGAVERALTEHPEVRDVAVVGVDDPSWGQRVVAVVVPADVAHPPTLDRLRAFVADHAGGWAAPRELRLVAALPLLPGGKVDRTALSESGGQMPA